MQIHLDALGGWSGDMFVAAMLDAFPAFWPEIEAAVASLGLGQDAACTLPAHNDGTLTGRRFVVAGEQEPQGYHRAHHHHHQDHDHHHEHHHDHDHHHHDADSRDHHHRAWADIRAQLQASALGPEVKRHAIGIFALLAEAEAEVHGLSTEDVAFHEVGAVDSIVDIVAAAQVIVLVGATSWTASPLPLGSGRIRTAHGMLPVPAPATALLLRGLSTIDDGIPGERVTPTGAAVARYLLAGDSAHAARQPRRLVGSGTGFGTRTLPGISNCLRVLAFDETLAEPAHPANGHILHRDLGVINFEVDDQSSEDLTLGLDLIRGMDGIHDITQGIMIGKKGRIATQVQVLVAPEHLNTAITACFEETTTIGLRYQFVRGALLSRSETRVAVGPDLLRVKAVVRPSGERTAKTEAGDVADVHGHANRTSLRKTGEAAAITKATTTSVEEDH